MDVSQSKGIAARSPLQQRLWLQGTAKHLHAHRQQALLAWQQSIVALWVNLCQWAKEEPFKYGLPQAALPYTGQPNVTRYLKLPVFVGAFLLALSSSGTVLFQKCFDYSRARATLETWHTYNNM